jgi:hypothetical protein
MTEGEQELWASHWRQRERILAELAQTNRQLHKLRRRSIFWPVCFAMRVCLVLNIATAT